MSTPQATAPNGHQLIDRLDSLKSSVRELIDRASKKPFATKATDAIKAHPFVAIAAAVGLGYLVVRIVRH